MAQESPQVGQDEIDQTLRAQASSAPSPGHPAPASPGAAEGLTPGTAAAGTATATDAHRTEALAGSPKRPGSDALAAGDVEFLLRQAEAALASVDAPHIESTPGFAEFRLEELGGAPASTEMATLELIRDVELDVRIELGRTEMHLEDVLRLRRGSVVALDKLAGDPVDIHVNGRLVARGEVLVLNENFCVRVNELVAAQPPRVA